jgi:hypothetical protein
VNAGQAWESIAALARPLQPYGADRRGALERILRITEEAREVHASSEPMREVARQAAGALGSAELKALTGALARIYTVALMELAAERHRP